MPKFFVISDIHSFYDEMIDALDNAGFDKDNSEHWLINLGDPLDRGPKSEEVMNYLMSLERKVLIKGNHEILLQNCIDRGYPMHHDYGNGTFRSVIDLAPKAQTFEEACEMIKDKVDKFVDSMVNYFETKNYIFVHSTYPMEKDWRNASQRAWDDAMWENPFEIFELYKPEKTVIFGHWHCSRGWAKLERRPEFGENAKFDPFYGDNYIAIDACTAHSGKVNVLVLEDEFL